MRLRIRHVWIYRIGAGESPGVLALQHMTMAGGQLQHDLTLECFTKVLSLILI